MFGLDDLIGPIVKSTLGSVIDRLVPDKNAREEHKELIEELEKELEFKLQKAMTDNMKNQMEINKEAAKSSHWFVAAARPAVIWLCAIGIGYATILQPLLTYILVACNVPHASELPTVQTDGLYQLLTGLLGMSAIRTYEKKNGIDTKRVNR